MVPLFTSSSGIDHYMVEGPNGGLQFFSSQDCDPILDRNKAMATENDGYSRSRELRRAASIPNIIALQWLNEEGWWMYNPDHADRLTKKLNDPDWAYLRTAPGRLALVNGVMR